MVRYGMAPQEGHLNATKRILGYLQAYPKILIRYNAQLLNFSMYKAHMYDWFWSYLEAKEALPHNMPKPQVAMTGQTLGLFWRQSCKLSQDTALWYQVSFYSSTVAQSIGTAGTGRTTVEHFDVWIGTHCWKHCSWVHHQCQVQTAHCWEFQSTEPWYYSEIISPWSWTLQFPVPLLRRDTLQLPIIASEKQLQAALWRSFTVNPETNLSNLLTKPLGPQTFQRTCEAQTVSSETNEWRGVGRQNCEWQICDPDEVWTIGVSLSNIQSRPCGCIGWLKLCEQCHQNGEGDQMYKNGKAGYSLD